MAASVSLHALILALCLAAATIAAFRFPLTLSRTVRVYVATVPYYVMAVLLSPPLAATAAALAELASGLLERKRRGSLPGDVATEVGRRAIAVLLGAWVAHVTPYASPQHPEHALALLGAAAVLYLTDLLTAPLVLAPISGESPRRILMALARDASVLEGMQYLIGLLGVLAARQQLLALALLALPTALVYVSSSALARAQEARQTAEEARRVAEEAVRVRDEFLIAASHDLRTPLTNILGRATLIGMRLERSGDVDGAWLRGQIRSLGDSTRRMSATVERLNDAAQLQMGRPLTLAMSPVDLGEVARSVTADANAGRTDDRVDVLVTGETGVLGDRMRLERVLENLIGNALKYSADGTPVSVLIEERGQWVVAEVRDRGMGIPADELPHIFDHFYRAANTTNIAGTGVGLSGVQAVVSQHGGHITVESAVGVGTTMAVYLPRAPLDHDEAVKAPLDTEEAEEAAAPTPTISPSA